MYPFLLSSPSPPTHRFRLKVFRRNSKYNEKNPWEKLSGNGFPGQRLLFGFSRLLRHAGTRGGGIFLYLLTQGRIKELLLLWISYYNSILRLISESSLLLFRIQFAHKWRISYIPLSECPTECFVGVSPSRPGCYCQPWICVQYLRIFRDYVTIINFGGWYWLINGE